MYINIKLYAEMYIKYAENTDNINPYRAFSTIVHFLHKWVCTTTICEKKCIKYALKLQPYL